ncbi:MAG: hypothetical protein R3B06_22985 [Kofleriaceae bacterium]
MAADDETVRARLRELEAEVSATAAADRQRQAAARERVAAQRAAASAEAAALRERQAELVTRKRRGPGPDRGASGMGDLERTVALARKAGDVKAELARPTGAGEKSWLVSAGLSFLFGPLGWLYAGSFRETIPAATLYLIVASIVAKIIPMFLLMPVLMVVLPVSGIAGLVYAIGHNRAGKRVRLFGDDGAATDTRIGGLLGRGDDKR